MRLQSSILIGLAATLFLGWGVFDRWFDADRSPEAPSPDAIAARVTQAAQTSAWLPSTRALYAKRSGAPLWTTATRRQAAWTLLERSVGEGIDGLGAEVPALLARARRADARWHGLDAAARDTLSDPRPAPLAALDVALTDGLLRYAHALSGSRVDAAQLYPGTWFPTVRDSSGTRYQAVVQAIETGDAARVARALGTMRPASRQYAELRTRLEALAGDLAPIPDGAPLAPGHRSVRVPHLRSRLAALGATGSGDAWDRRDPYLFDRSLAGALALFEAARGLPADSVLDAQATEALNQDLRETLALNLERWRWLPDDLGDRYVMVNLPAYELHVMEREGDGYAERLTMPVNIGNAQTTGWTTPVITDSIYAVEFQPVWYVPRSLAAANVFPMAVRDSLALYRQGFEVYQNGRLVDSRFVQWDSVSVGAFRFVQRPGPANPLGRAKFMMHNPYSILIHDTNKRWTLEDGAGSSMSSGCVHAGDPAALAEYLLTTTNGWKEGEATAAYRRGPRRGVRLDQPVRTHFVYLTAWVDEAGMLHTYGDPYGYEAPLARALRRRAPVAAPADPA